VAEARRRAMAVAAPCRFGEDANGRRVLAVTEGRDEPAQARRGGHILLRALARKSVAGVEVIAFDKGPGWRTYRQACATAIRHRRRRGWPRVVAAAHHGLEIFSQPGRGTVCRFEAWPDTRRSARGRSRGRSRARYCVASAERAVRRRRLGVPTRTTGRYALIVARERGCGMGPKPPPRLRAGCHHRAALSSTAPRPSRFASIHAALRHKRAARGRPRWCGGCATDARESGKFSAAIGNYRRLLEGRAQFDHKSAQASGPGGDERGRSGFMCGRTQEVPAFRFPHGGVLIMALATAINTQMGTSDSTVGWPRRHPSVIADGDCSRIPSANGQTNDATVVVLKHRAAHG
jgi:hypothetical protein